MVMLSCNGVAIPVFRDSMMEEEELIGEVFARGISGRMTSSFSARKRKWKFRTPPLKSSDAELYRMWLEGQGQCWNFDSSPTAYSGQGVQNTFAGTWATSTTLGKYRGKITVGSGSQFTIDPTAKLAIKGGWSPTVNGWSIMAWRKFIAAETFAAGYHHCALTGAVSMLRGVAANPAGVSQYVDGVLANTAALGNCFAAGSSASNVSGLYGFSTGNVANAIDFDDYVIYPFQIPSTWIAGIYAFANTQAWPALPRVLVSGDAFEDTNPIEVVCRVRSVSYMQATLPAAGVSKPNVRVLEVEINEW